jgi:hypothetical protein
MLTEDQQKLLIAENLQYRKICMKLGEHWQSFMQFSEESSAGSGGLQSIISQMLTDRDGLIKRVGPAFTGISKILAVFIAQLPKKDDKNHGTN